MTKYEFIDLLHTELDFYDEILRQDVTEETDLTTFSNWDSLSRATVYNLAGKLGIKVSHMDLKDCKTVQDIINLLNI